MARGPKSIEIIRIRVISGINRTPEKEQFSYHASPVDDNQPLMTARPF